MGKVIMIALLTYLIWTAICYIRWRTPKKKNQSVDWDEYSGKSRHRKSDIMGKSKFDLSHSPTQAATSLKTEKEIEKANTFAAQNEKMMAIDDIEDAFSDSSSEEENESLDIYIPLEFETEEETDEEEMDGALQSVMASGIRFDELGNMLEAIDRKREISQPEKEAAGNTLLEIRQTDMFEQLVSEKPDRREMVSQLIEESLAAFHRSKERESEYSKNGDKAPESFDIRNYL